MGLDKRTSENRHQVTDIGSTRRDRQKLVEVANEIKAMGTFSQTTREVKNPYLISITSYCDRKEAK
ncbi:MAG: hypothetical protein V7K69_33075 [Nostoc sp.]|uniref:hypothetical protein n=1 Tax=Nostoc sp. TaxID=1180 RepID=UPI002FF44BA2